MNTLFIALLKILVLSLFMNPHSATRVFYDGFESGNISAWERDEYHDLCTVESQASDRVAGPYKGKSMARCNSNGTVLWNTSKRYESMKLPSISMANEVLYRFAFRADQNHDKTYGSAKKIFRFFVPGIGNDAFWTLYRQSPGLVVTIVNNGDQLQNYWGEHKGDQSAQPGKWHVIEMYVRYNPGRIRVWHDNILVKDETLGKVIPPWGETGEVYITSNFSDEHDAENHLYFDEVEVFSDDQTGQGVTGSLFDGTVSVASTNINRLSGNRFKKTVDPAKILILDVMGKQVKNWQSNSDQIFSGIYHVVSMEKGKRIVKRKVFLP